MNGMSKPAGMNGVCAVIITFRPNAEALANLAKVRPQVQDLVVVDNGSSAEALDPFREASGDLHFTLIENGENLGIAAALNIGVAWAKSQRYPFIVLFDQDSTITSGFIHNMLATYCDFPHRDRLAIVTPSQIEKSTGRARLFETLPDGGPLVAITSGSLMPTRIFDICGFFEEDLIIDCVDHEYCLRARSRGYTLAQSAHAVLRVSVGAVREYRFLGLSFNATHHSAPRRYYITRNRLVLIRRYWRQHPRWCYGTFKDIVKNSLAACAVEEQPISKLVNTLRGTLDALRGRMGKVVEL
jgi:rhamnosyltransferase